jgi:hypothetical protein
MSLAPRERRTLASMEDSLCASDPRLAAMLATFTLPGRRTRLLIRARGFGKRIGRGRVALLRHKRPILTVLVLAVLLLTMIGLLSRTTPGQRLCAPGQARVSAGSSMPVCQPGIGADDPAK